MADTLFDPDIYGPGRKPRSAKADRASLPIEDHIEPWCVLRTTRGVLPFFHLPRGLNDYSSTVALCGATGTKVHNIGVDQMIRCPLCQLETDW
jgi:hypothetical protein